MQIVVTIVAKEHHRVLPASGILVVHVVDGLVDHSLGIVGVTHREASHGHIKQVGCFGVGALAVVKQGIETVVHIAGNLVEGVLAFEGEQVIVGV